MNGNTDSGLAEQIAEALILRPYVRGQLNKIGPAIEKRDAERIAMAHAVIPLVRAAQAEALRDAADSMGEWADEPYLVAGDAFDEGTWTEVPVGEWLRARANMIEQEETE